MMQADSAFVRAVAKADKSTVEKLLDDEEQLLAFLLAIRFAFDTWDTVYYPLPFIFALLAWETLQQRRPPVLSLVASVVVWLVYVVAPEQLSADAQAALFLFAAVPTLLVLGIALLAPGARLPGIRRVPHARAALSRAPAVPS